MCIEFIISCTIKPTRGRWVRESTRKRRRDGRLSTVGGDGGLRHGDTDREGEGGATTDDGGHRDHKTG